MLKQRIAAMDAVQAAFMPVERLSQQLATAGAQCLVTMLEERQAANLPPDAGSEAINLIAEAVAKATETRELLGRAHVVLAKLPGTIGLKAYGTSPCQPNQPFTGAIDSSDETGVTVAH